MSYSLLIHFSNYPEKTVDWAIFDKTGLVIDTATQVLLDTVPAEYSPVFVLISGTEILLTQTSIPSKQRQRILQALPFALEEELADNIESLHFAIGEREAQSDNITVAVIARSIMDDIIQQLQTLNIKADVIMPDFLALPESSQVWSVFYSNNKVLVRTGVQAGFSIEKENLITLLQMALNEHKMQAPKQLIVFKDKKSIADIDALQVLNMPIKANNHNHSALAWLVKGLVDKTPPLNLLQGDYRPVSKSKHIWRRWRLTAILLLSLFALQAIQQVIDYQQLKNKRAEFETQIEEIYRQTFPSARRIVNPRVQMEQQLKALRSQHGGAINDGNFLLLFNQISIPLSQAKGLNIQRIDYKSGQFDIHLEVADWQAWEYLKRKLEALNLSVEKQSATSNNNVVQSHLRIQRK